VGLSGWVATIEQGGCKGGIGDKILKTELHGLGFR
jgi:hypothetical protein